MAQNPFGGPPPFGAPGPNFPPPFQPGVPYFAAVPPHMLQQQQQQFQGFPGQPQAYPQGQPAGFQPGTGRPQTQPFRPQAQVYPQGNSGMQHPHNQEEYSTQAQGFPRNNSWSQDQPMGSSRSRKAKNLTVFDSSTPESIRNVPNPFERLEDFPGISQQQLRCFYDAGFTGPTPIQAQSWPIAMMERDVISIAKTGDS